MIVNNVSLLFLPAGAPAAEAVSAPNQHVYIDITAGTMTHAQSNAKGLIVGAPLAAKAVDLDDSRDYQVVVSPTALAAPPASTQGVTLRVASGKLLVPPHIAVKINSTTAGAVGNLACSLTVGTTTNKVTSSSAGWVVSNDKGSGVVSLRADTKTLSNAAPAKAAATLTLAPTAPKRGEATTISIAAPSGAVGFKVTAWAYDISHTNPGNSSASTATVTRPATEDPGTFDQSWTGELVASGKLRVSFVTGVSLRTTGDTAVKATVIASDVAEATQDVTAAARTGATWQSTLVEKPVADLVKAITSFKDTGHHGWASSGGSVNQSPSLAAGPNRGCIYITSAAVTFTSSPQINKLLSDASSAFSQAQGKAYLVTPAPVRVIPSDLYTVGAQGAITIKSIDTFRTRMNIPDSVSNVSFSAQCIDQATLLAGTRRHESEDPAPSARSHKGNCLKARRALDPITFAEALVKLPGETLNLQTLINTRIQTVLNVGPIHDIVDEANSLKNQKVELVSGAEIANVNADSAGKLIAPVWNPTRNTELTN